MSEPHAHTVTPEETRAGGDAPVPATAEQERRRLRTIFEHTPALIIVLRGRDLVVDVCTPPALRLFGGRIVAGRSLLETAPELQDQGFFELLRRVHDTGEPFVGREYPVTIDRTGAGDLETGHFDLVYTPTHDEQASVDGVMILAQDVSAQVHARRELERALAARDEFLAVAGHELGTPLAILQLSMDGVRRTLQANAGLDATTRERLDRAARAARRLARVRDSLLEVARHRNAPVTLEPDEVDLAAVLRGIAGDLADVARQSRSTLTVEAPEPLPGRLDEDRVGHALSTIVENALKFGRGRPVKVRAHREGAEARVEVVDHGIGIAPEDQARIFEAFERAVSARDYGGLGLGLWLARRILVSSGGDVAVESEPGVGTRFVVRLPIHQPAGTRPK